MNVKSGTASIFRGIGKDSPMKIIAVAVAIVIFSIVRMFISEKTTVTAKVEIVPTSKDGALSVTKYEPAEVDILLSGTEEAIKNIRDEKVVVKVQPSGIPQKEDVDFENLKIEPKDVFGAGSARVVSLSPAVIHLEYDKEGEVSLPVRRPQLTGKPLLGTAELIWIETNVTVRGGMSQINLLRESGVELHTESIDVDGRSRGFTKKVKILKPSDSGAITLMPQEIDVKVAITTETETRVFENIPVQLTTITGGGMLLSSDPALASVRITGMKEHLNILQPSDITVLADCRSLADSRGKTTDSRVPLRVYLPVGIEGLRPAVEPAEAKIHAERMAASSVLQVEPSVRVEGSVSDVGPVPPTSLKRSGDME